MLGHCLDDLQTVHHALVLVQGHDNPLLGLVEEGLGLVVSEDHLWGRRVLERSAGVDLDGCRRLLPAPSLGTLRTRCSRMLRRSRTTGSRLICTNPRTGSGPNLRW